MKVLILSAGRGERLRPLTDTTPKPLLKAGQYRLIEYTIQALVKAGFCDIIINIAHLSEQFPITLGHGEKYGATIHYSVEPEGGLETAGAIVKALPLLGNQPFLVVNGDIWTDFPYQQLVGSLNDQLCHLILVANPSHHPTGDFSLTEKGRIEQSSNTQKYTYSGIGIYHPSLFLDLVAGQRFALKPLLLKAIAQTKATGILYSGEWSDIGTIERLQALEQKLTIK